MAVTITSTLAGSNADYGRYLYEAPRKSDRMNEPTLFDFALVPFEAAFVKLQRGNYISVNTTLYGTMFTGYITNDPTLEYLGNKGNKTPVWGYRYEASSDEVILSHKPIGLFTPFVNTTQGAILKALIAALDITGVFDTTNIQAGQTIARFVPDPTKTLSDIIKQFCDASQFRFWCKSHVCHFEQADATPATIVIDGNDKYFTPSNLSIQVTPDPIINDAIVLGQIEPQNFITEYFVGDGTTAQFPLMSDIYGVDRSVLLDDSFGGSTVDATKWTLFDTVSPTIVLSNGFVNAIGGANQTAPYTFTQYLQSAQLVPLEGALRLTHGEYDFVSASDGVICSLWIGSSITSSLAGCAYGIQASKSGANTILKPINNGVVDGTQSLTVNYSSRYVIRTVLNFYRAHRQEHHYSYIDQNGNVIRTGGLQYDDTMLAQTYIVEVNPSNGAVVSTTTWFNSTTLPSSSNYAYYVPLALNDLHCTFTGVTLSTPMQVRLAIQPSGTGSFFYKLVGPNEMDSMDGLAPFATVTDNNSGATTRSSFLGTPQYNSSQALLQFFKNSVASTSTVPAAKDIIRLSYRRAGAAVAHVQDRVSVATEATNWGDNGVRSVTKNNLSPQPRTSSECEQAAAALVRGNNYQHYQGSYTQPSGYSFTGEPMSGTVLKFQNLPASFPSALKAEGITEVVTTIDCRSPEHFTHTLNFGRIDRLQRLLAKFAGQPDVFQPQDSAEIPTYIDVSALGNTSLPSVIAPVLVSVDASNFTFNTNQVVLNPNILLQTAALSATGTWNRTQLTSVTDNSTDFVDPNGNHNATKIVCNGGTDPTLGQSTANIGVLTGQQFTGSVWVLGSGATIGKTFTLFMYNNSVTQIYTRSVVLTGDWQRIKLSVTWTSTTDTAFTFRLDPVDSPTFASGDTVYVWGPQCQAGLAVTDYIPNGAGRDSVGGFEVRYTDESWGCDAAKNLVTRTVSQSFTVPRNSRGKVCFVKAYDTRNKIPYSEDLTQSGWTKDGSTAANSTLRNPDGEYAQITTLTPVSGNKRAYCFASPWITPALLQVAASAWVKGTLGDTCNLVIGNNVTQNFSTTVTLNGKWQRVPVSGTFDAAGSIGNTLTSQSGLFVQITLGASPVKVTRVNVEVNTLTETIYCKTNGSAYGALSRFAAGLKVGFPLIPATPTATVDVTNPLYPIVTVGLPAIMTDVWGVEVRLSNDVTVVLHKDLTDASFVPSFVWDNSTTKARAMSWKVYTYNLLGEYSAVYNLNVTIPTPAASAVNVDDNTKLLYWTETNPATGYQVDMDATDSTMTHVVNSWTTATPAITLSDPNFFNQRWFRITPYDVLGNGTASSVLSHSYTPTGVVEFNGNEVAVIPAPTTPTTDPVVPRPLSDFPRQVIDRGWNNHHSILTDTTRKGL
jgi:hypothetical protein